MKPEYGLGIDAGGTYTDVVLLDFVTGKVVTAQKALTTQADHSEGIRAALAQVDADLLSQVSLVSLTTTFATNAIVENRGRKAGLILVGYEQMPPDIPPATNVLMVGGGHTVTGEEKASLDLGSIEERLDTFLEGLDAVAVAGFFSVRNPEHELQVAKLIRDRYDLPVVCGHSLSMQLDAVKRATTAWWNARLIPLISNLIQATNTVLSERAISAPLMVVRGDGTLMSSRMALDRPIETLLSGPAASIVGARHLSCLENAVVVDIGGTTTDIALLMGGKVAIDPQGAQVGKWKTNVEAAKVKTIGLGGDSLISISDDGNFWVGPQRVIPLCVLAKRNPKVVDVLKKILQCISKSTSFRSLNPCSFYIIRPHGGKLHAKTILSEYAGSGFVSEFLQFRNPDHWSSVWELRQYEREGIIFLSSLTPTDIRVATGRLQFGNHEAAQLGLRIFAQYIGMDESIFAKAVEDEIEKKLCLEVFSFVENADDKVLSWLEQRLFQKPLFQNLGMDLNIQVTLSTPGIGVGAPAAAYLPRTFRNLNSICVLPDSYSVAGGVGAIVGTVGISLTGEIRRKNLKKYSLHTIVGKEMFETLEQAIDRGRVILETIARQQMHQNNVSKPVVNFSIEDKEITTGHGQTIHVETLLHLRATGRPNLEEQSKNNMEYIETPYGCNQLLKSARYNEL
jgi:N-methylhydantoinase A/oxoprolinase/acetone carboxylase beta subunit